MKKYFINSNSSAMEDTDIETRKKRIRAIDVIAYFLCLLLSFGIWLYVLSLESENYEYTFTNIAVQLEGINDLKGHDLSIISGYDTEVSVTVSGSRREILKYTSEDVFAHVDISNISEADRYSLDVMIDLPDNMKLVSTEPSKINVMVDETTTTTLDLKVNLLYNVAADLTIHEPEPNFESVTVTGPKSILDTIVGAHINCNLGSVTTSVNVNAPIVLVDADNNEIVNPYIKTDVSEVMVKVPVTMERELPMEAVFTATDIDRYEYLVSLSVNESVHTLKVSGDPHIVSKMTSVKIDIGDITNASGGTVTLESSVKLETGVEIFDDSIKVVKYAIEKNPIGDK